MLVEKRTKPSSATLEQSKHLVVQARYRHVSSDDLHRSFAKTRPLSHKRIKETFLEPLKLPFQTDLRSARSCHGDGLRGPSAVQRRSDYADYIALNPEKVIIMRKFFNSQSKSRRVVVRRPYKRPKLKPKKCAVSDTALSSSPERPPQEDARKEIRSADNCRSRAFEEQPSPCKLEKPYFIKECDGFGINTYNVSNSEKICLQETATTEHRFPTKQERSHQHVHHEPLQLNNDLIRHYKHDHVPHTGHFPHIDHTKSHVSGNFHEKDYVQVHYHKSNSFHKDDRRTTVSDTKHFSRKTDHRYPTSDSTEFNEATVKRRTDTKTVMQCAENAREAQKRYLEVEVLRQIKHRVEKLEKKMTRNEAATISLQKYITNYILKTTKSAPCDTLANNNVIKDQLWRMISKNKHFEYKLALPILLIWYILYKQL